jgi:hypothetical protein
MELNATSPRSLTDGSRLWSSACAPVLLTLTLIVVPSARFVA